MIFTSFQVSSLFGANPAPPLVKHNRNSSVSRTPLPGVSRSSSSSSVGAASAPPGPAHQHMHASHNFNGNGNGNGTAAAADRVTSPSASQEYSAAYGRPHADLNGGSSNGHAIDEPSADRGRQSPVAGTSCSHSFVNTLMYAHYERGVSCTVQRRNCANSCF